MLPSRGLRSTKICINNASRRLMVPVQGARNFSINATTSNSTLITRRSPSIRLKTLQQHRNLSLFGWGSTPKTTSGPDSTQSATADVEIGPSSTGLENVRTFKADHTTSATPDPAQVNLHHSSGNHEPQILQDLQDKLTLPHGDGSEQVTSIIEGETDITTVPERMGYLKEVCGLDFGWGPSAIMEWILEFMHVNVGLSWTASVIGVAAFLRIAMFKPIIDSQVQGAKMREMQPFIKPLREKYSALMRSGDQAKAQETLLQMREINKSSGISYARAFIPLFIQIPFSFGAFRVLRNAGNLPVPAFVTEDWLWTTDLSFHDPYYLTPLISSAMIYLSFNLQRGSNNAMMGPEMMKLISVGLPLLSFVFMCRQPGAVQLYFMVTGMFAFGTAAIIRQPWFRNWVKLGALPTAPPPPPPAATSSSSIMGTRTPVKQTALPAGMQRLNTPTTSRPTPTGIESANTAGQDRSVIDRALDGFKGHVKDLSKAADKMVSFGKTKAEQTQKAKQAANAKLDALRQREFDREREERNKQARGGQH